MLTESPVLKGALHRQKGLLGFSEALLRCTDQITGGFAELEGNSANLHPKREFSCSEDFCHCSASADWSVLESVLGRGAYNRLNTIDTAPGSFKAIQKAMRKSSAW